MTEQESAVFNQLIDRYNDAFRVAGKKPSDRSTVRAMRATADLFQWCASRLSDEATQLEHKQLSKREAVQWLDGIIQTFDLEARS